MRTYLLLTLLVSLTASAQELPSLGPDVDPPPREMLRSYLTGIADQQLAERHSAVANLRTRDEVRRRQEKIRAAMREFMGGLPEERTPLNWRRTGSLDRDGYRIDKIVYESLPEFYVTASLYIPATGSPPYPAVIQPVGHSQTAKARGLYQSLSIGLVRNGFVVLTYDPIGQGERTIFYEPDIESSLVGSTTQEHQMVGVQSLLANESVARYRVWDGMRGIDLLQSLPEVDGERIGVAGCSGGGTLSAYIAAVDERVKVAAPACYMSAWEEQLQGTGPQDAEQQFPGQLAAGINHGDFIIAFAPKPYLMCNTTEDFFPIGGALRTLTEARGIYEIFDAPDKIDQYVGTGGHGMRPDTRSAIYTWMSRWLKDAPDVRIPEPDHMIEHDEDLYVTETGQVATSLGGETASTWNIKRFSAIEPDRGDLTSRGAVEQHAATVRDAVARLTRYKKPAGALNLRTHATIERPAYELELLTYDAAPGCYVPAYLCTPATALSKTILYIDDRGKGPAFEPGADADRLCSVGYTVLALDLAGTGETAPIWGSYSSEWFGSDKTTWLALMIGRPLVGLRMADVVRGLDVLADRGLLPGGSATGFARGKSGVVLLHSAAVDTRLSVLMLEDPLVSYRAIATTPIHRRVFSSVVPGVLGEYDLQDLAVAIAPRPVELINVRSPLGSLMQTDNAAEHYRQATNAFRALGKSGAFRIGLRRENESLESAYPGLEDSR